MSADGIGVLGLAVLAAGAVPVLIAGVSVAGVVRRDKAYPAGVGNAKRAHAQTGRGRTAPRCGT